jgi:cellulose biosynthesis protein BcsQ
MSPDVQQLLRVVRVPGFRYRELGAPARRPATRTEAPHAGVRRDFTVAVVSLVRGVGRTTVAANLAAALGRLGLSTLAVDLDPGDALRSHFAAARAPGAIAVSVTCVPFGAAASAVLDALDADPDAFVLDMPAGVSSALEQALGSVDEVVIVVRPDPRSLEAVPATEALLARTRLRMWRRLRARYVVNAFDGRRSADREVLARLRAQLGGRLWPVPIQADEGVRAAHAARRSLEAEVPESQVVADIAGLAADLARADSR